ncbi:MAG TPA: methyltransferase domain-containing protein [Candidatus Limnocylindrales bacterium]|nr:methyltransferase domain-containing protein [Candidatus Limnocylindrales bacterium]
MNLQQEFGNIDIYLFDQLLRNRIPPGMTIFDAGCGGGRNLVYFLRNGYEVYAIDQHPQSIPNLPPANFRAEAIESTTLPEAIADIAIASAVLHFARSDDHFQAMLTAIWKRLKPKGLLFARLASSIGIETQIQKLNGRRHLLPDGSERYLVDEQYLLDLTHSLNGTLEDPIKTTVVQNQRAMTTWVLKSQ